MPPIKPTKPTRVPPAGRPPDGFLPKHMKRFVVRIYTSTALYAGDVELLDEFVVPYPHVNSFNAYKSIRELVTGIGETGYHHTVDENSYVFYPPHRIHYIEYVEV